MLFAGCAWLCLVVFGCVQDDDDASAKKVEAAEAAEEWLRDMFDTLSVDEISTKFRQLRAMS